MLACTGALTAFTRSLIWELLFLPNLGVAGGAVLHAILPPNRRTFTPGDLDLFTLSRGWYSWQAALNGIDAVIQRSRHTYHVVDTNRSTTWVITGWAGEEVPADREPLLKIQLIKNTFFSMCKCSTLICVAWPLHDI